jgi:hypothetical protein
VNKILPLSVQMILTLLISLIIVISIGNFQHYNRSLILVVYAQEGKDSINNINNILVTIAENNNIFGNLAKQFDIFSKQFE